MVYYNLAGEFNDKTIIKFTEFLNNIELTEDIIIYLNSGGGDAYVTFCLLDIIHSYPGKITLVATGRICSSAFDLFFEAKVNKKILPRTIGMTHISTWKAIINSNLQGVDEFEIFKFEYLKDDHKYLDVQKKFINFSKEEVTQIRSGKELWLNTTRLNELLEFNKIKLKIKPQN